MELPEITKVEKIDVQSGDYLAVFIKGNFPFEIHERIRQQLVKDFLPKNVTVKIFNADLVELKVLRVSEEIGE
jgi:hypothetical protein